ncbi:MAG: inositol monophosphatase family protein [Gammaproteobacteria bacterium]
MLLDINQLQEIMVHAAQRELLPRLAQGSPHYQHKPDGSIVTAADIAVQHYLRTELARRWPQYAFVGEEMSVHDQHLSIHHPAGFWCLDPLDGTTNFAAGIPFFAISLALIVGGETLVGLVYDPVREECFTARKGSGAWLNNTRLHQRPASPTLRDCIAVVDFKRLTIPITSRLVAGPPYASQRNFGSVALEWCWLSADRFHVYLHGRQQLWDYAAGSLILREAGGHAMTLEGNKVGDGLQACSAVAALDSALFEEWRTWIQANN